MQIVVTFKFLGYFEADASCGVGTSEAGAVTTADCPVFTVKFHHG